MITSRKLLSNSIYIRNQRYYNSTSSCEQLVNPQIVLYIWELWVDGTDWVVKEATFPPLLVLFVRSVLTCSQPHFRLDHLAGLGCRLPSPNQYATYFAHHISTLFESRSMSVRVRFRSTSSPLRQTLNSSHSMPTILLPVDSRMTRAQTVISEGNPLKLLRCWRHQRSQASTSNKL